MDLKTWFSLIALGIGTILTAISLKSKKHGNSVKIAGAIFLILSALIATYATYQSNKLRDEQATATYTEVNQLGISIKGIKENVDLVNDLSEDIKIVRLNLEGSFEEYKNLNEKLKQQLKIEREKIKNAKPNIKIVNPISIIDSVNFAYQYRFYNDDGKRDADSLYYYALMVFSDTNIENLYIGLFKSNVGNYKPYNIGGGDQQYINSNNIRIENLIGFRFGFLLIRYKYTDLMTGETIDELEIRKCTDLEKGNIQYGTNVAKYIEDRIKNYLLNNYNEYYKLFYF